MRWRPISTKLIMKNPPAAHGILSRHNHWRPSLPVLFLYLMCTIALGYACLFQYCNLLHIGSLSELFSSGISKFHKNRVEAWKTNPKRNHSAEFELICNLRNSSDRNCPANYEYPSKFPAVFLQGENPGPIHQQEPTCPEYFRWIHQDLFPWRETGITLDMVERGTSNKTHFRLVIVNGTAYVETYRESIQTRDMYTQWGILQLLRLYPGKIPDLDLVFNSQDRPSVPKEFYSKPEFRAPPPVFGYDGDDFNLGIAFPDWSFWGWPETSIKPWEFVSRDLKEGNERSRWVDRDKHAYWKGNHKMSTSRKELLKCNVSENKDSNALIYIQDWKHEEKEGFKNSNLANQCNHRYKIYIEGIGWSVSRKYILSCDSVTLIVKPRYYDFFSRSLMPLQHYWPIRVEDKCRSIQYAVDWGNTHQQEAQVIGKAASSFIQQGLQMKYIYDYMFHVLTAYAKLLRYKPTVPPKAVQICPESLVCSTEEKNKKYLIDSAVRAPSDTPPCTLPPPYDPPTLQSLLKKKENSFKQVEAWEKQYWDAHSTSNL